MDITLCDRTNKVDYSFNNRIFAMNLMDEILSQTKLLSKEQVEKLKEEFAKQEDLIKGDCFSDLLDNVDKHIH